MLFFSYYGFYSQENQGNQIYFIGEKLEEKHIPFTINYISAKKADCKENEEDEECYPKMTRPLCKGRGEYYSKYKIIKILKGKYLKDTIEFSSLYCSEFGYRYPIKNKYVIIGVGKSDTEWFQYYIEKVYKRSDKWILPCKATYPFINYQLTKPQKLKNSQRVKLNISKEYYETLHIGEYNLPYYQKRRKYATALCGFVL